ncbi:maleylacetate reductase [Phyllobacterium lublinensis]|uniref:maleylacetate reductase n=1 Tax=Phyllobacterium lublinensis TaxID=2875708 RepID=UPI001CC94435|nr:maleylacetate reductase [Phyllobacterium sp. 2063]MBZ9653456.1 maleylacetate reductase [Phyllobacterium sp. 2063]
MNFTYNALPTRVIFGSGTLSELPAEVDRLGIARALILTTSHQGVGAQRIAQLLSARTAGVFGGAVMHTPVEVTDDAIALANELRIDGLVAIGGGSTTGLSKAIALRTDLPQVVVPTTYAGSEMTPIIGETSNGKKVTQSSPRVLPETVLYDVDLTMTLPTKLSGTSGINAIAHAVEALYAKDRNPVVSLMALAAIKLLAKSLPLIAENPLHGEARADALQGAWLSGICLGSVGMALHHKLCHTLGGTFNLPHAETHAVILPHALAYNAAAVPDVMSSLGEALGTNNVPLFFYELAGRIGADRSLHSLGMDESGVSVAVDEAFANPYWNPRPLERMEIEALLCRAFNGESPLAGKTVTNKDLSHGHAKG